MKKLTLAVSLLCSICLLGLLAACGDETPEDTNQSAEAKAITKEVGGAFTVSEFKKFLKVLPTVPGLTTESQQAMGGVGFSAKVQKAIEDAGWEQDRFMYIYSHSIAIMNIEQMEQLTEQMTAEMDGMSEEQKKMMDQMLSTETNSQMKAVKAEIDKQVPASEQVIIRDNIDDLYTAMGITRQ